MNPLLKLMKSIPSTILVGCLVFGFAMNAGGGEKQAPENPYWNALEQAGFMSLDSTLSSNIGDMSSRTYGFSASLPQEKRFFKIGMYVVNIEAAISSSDKDKMQKNIERLSSAFKNEGAPVSCLNSLNLMNKEMFVRTVSFSEARYMFNALKPIMSEFVRSKGKDAMFMCAFGEWTQALSVSIESVLVQKDNHKIQSVIRLGLGADSFSAGLSKSTFPKGLVASLKKIQELATKEAPDQRDARRISKETEDIMSLMAI